MIGAMKSLALQMAIKTGRFIMWPDAQRELRQLEPVWFSGDIPYMAGTEYNQYPIAYATPRPEISHVTNVLYTPEGMAWIGGSLDARYSFFEAGVKQIYSRPGKPVKTYEQATICQSQTPKTYGDWISEQLCSLCRAKDKGELVEPVLLPAWWHGKSYVQRDLAILGVRSEAVTEPVLIKHAVVAHKSRISHHWTKEEAASYNRQMKFAPADCRPGSALYLSRLGEKCEGAKREIRNDITEAAMQAAGVPVFRTVGKKLEDFKAMAEHAETVFYDHGSAFYNVSYWKTLRMVEFHMPRYWDPGFMFFFAACGFQDYHVWRISDETTVEGLAERIRALLSTPAGREPDPVRAKVKAKVTPWKPELQAV